MSRTRLYHALLLAALATTPHAAHALRVDYVVEDRASGRIMLLIELDDRTHNASKDRDRDQLTARAGYTTVRLPASERPTAESVRRHIGNAFGAPSTSDASRKHLT